MKIIIKKNKNVRKRREYGILLGGCLNHGARHVHLSRCRAEELHKWAYDHTGVCGREGGTLKTHGICCFGLVKRVKSVVEQRVVMRDSRRTNRD